MQSHVLMLLGPARQLYAFLIFHRLFLSEHQCLTYHLPKMETGACCQLPLALKPVTIPHQKNALKSLTVRHLNHLHALTHNHFV